MPPIYLHGNRYKEHNYTTSFSATVALSFGNAFSPPMTKRLHAALVKICTSKGDTATMAAIFQLCRVHFQHIGAEIQLLTQFLGHNPLIYADELTEKLALWERCMAIWNMSPLLRRATHSLTALSSPSGLRKHQASVKCQWMQFLPHGGIQLNIFALYTFMSDCPSAAICSMATKCNQQLWKGSNSIAITPIYCHNANIRFWLSDIDTNIIR